MEIGTNNVAVCVRPTTIVCATAVLTEFESGAEILGAAQAWERINKTITDKRVGIDLNMVPPFGQQGRYDPKNRIIPPMEDVFFSRFVPAIRYIFQIKNPWAAMCIGCGSVTCPTSTHGKQARTRSVRERSIAFD
jgi:hypothetical protein